jgi:hypothetical protein
MDRSHRPHTHSIASDHQRAALVRAAVGKGVEQARGDFYYGLLSEGLDDESVALFAGEEWQRLARHMIFDYPQFARKLYLHAYQLAYRMHLSALVTGHSLSTQDLVAAVEAEIGLTPPPPPPAPAPSTPTE